MERYVTVIGGVNMDISAALTAPFVPADSVPGQVTLGCGGVARNIAHNLRLMGHEVKFVSAFGGETFGEMCWRECQAIGLDLSLSERFEGMRNGLYLCVNDQTGDMIAAVADTDIIDHITPAFLEARIMDISNSALVIADTNISTEALLYLIDHCTAPLMVDTVSTAKAPRVIKALQQSHRHHLHALKLNLIEAQEVTHCHDRQGCRPASHRHGRPGGLYHPGQRRRVLQRRHPPRALQRHPHPRAQHNRGWRRFYCRSGTCPSVGHAVPRLCAHGDAGRPCHPTLSTDRQSRHQVTQQVLQGKSNTLKLKPQN